MNPMEKTPEASHVRPLSRSGCEDEIEASGPEESVRCGSVTAPHGKEIL
jgi:hypothetical protein